MSIQFLLAGLELTTFYYESPPVTTRQGLRPKEFFTLSFPASRGGGPGGLLCSTPLLRTTTVPNFVEIGLAVLDFFTQVEN